MPLPPEPPAFVCVSKQDERTIIIELDALLARLWHEYRSMNPQVDRIHALLRARGETIVNDHIAFRTFDHPSIGLDALAKQFVKLGYQPCENYHFEEKKLNACHYEHPSGHYPRIFISELQLARCSAGLQQIVSGLIDQLDPARHQFDSLVDLGQPWQLTSQDFKLLADESEYAGWVAAFGFRANHFTILVNALKTFPSLESLNTFLKSSGFSLNTSGGEIKGSPQTMLEQSSTLADIVSVTFSDAAMDVPCCYYEFARRYPQADGRLFSGFVTRSADRIFESTHRR